MKPFEKILLPVDFSAHSEEAIRLGADLSRRYEAAVTLLHVYEPVAYALPEGYVLYTPEQLSGLLSSFEERLDKLKVVAKEAGAHSVETKLVQGIAASEIVDCARNGGYDLIVMGTHGRTGIKHALMGSVAEKVGRTAPCPVLTTRVRDRET